MARRVYRWQIPINDEDHQIPAGAVLRAEAAGDLVEVWVEHLDDTAAGSRLALRIFGTGHVIPDGYRWVATCARTAGGLVWHLYSRAVPAAAQPTQDGDPL